MLTVRLPKSIEKRLEKLARRTGRSKSYLARKAIIEHLEDFDDIYLAEKVLKRIHAGKMALFPLKRL